MTRCTALTCDALPGMHFATLSGELWVGNSAVTAQRQAPKAGVERAIDAVLGALDEALDSRWKAISRIVQDNFDVQGVSRWVRVRIGEPRRSCDGGDRNRGGQGIYARDFQAPTFR